MRGVNAAAWVLALALAISILGGLGFYDHLGASSSGAGLDDDVGQVNESIGGSQDVSEEGGGESYLGFTTATTGALSAVWTLITSTSTALQWMGVPPGIANPMQTFARFMMGLAILQFARGFKAE